MDDSPPPVQPMSAAVAKGCLLGLVLAAMWGALGLGLYVLIRALGGSLGLGIFVGALGGPLVGSALFLVWWLRRYSSSR